MQLPTDEPVDGVPGLFKVVYPEPVFPRKPVERKGLKRLKIRRSTALRAGALFLGFGGFASLLTWYFFFSGRSDFEYVAYGLSAWSVLIGMLSVAAR